LNKRALLIGLAVTLITTGAITSGVNPTLADTRMMNEAEDVTEGVLTLDTAYQLALENSFDLKKEYINLEEAKLELDKIKDIEDMDVSDLVILSSGGNPANVIFTADKNAEARIQIKVIPEKLRNSVLLIEKDIELQKLSLKSQVETAYFNLLEAHENLILAKANEERTKRALQLTSKRFEQGLAIKSEVLDSEIMLEQAQVGILSAKSSVDLAWMNFNKLIGKDLDSQVQVDLQTSKLQLPDINLTTDQLLDLAYENRLALQSLELNLSTEQYTLEIYESTYHGVNDSVKSQRYVVEKAKLDIENTKQNIELQVLQAYNQWNSSRIQLTILEKSVEKASESLRLAELSYENGVATSYEVLSAQIGLKEAQTNLVHTKYQILISYSQVENTVGISLDNLKR
jgi:outer membrane protein TolC